MVEKSKNVKRSSNFAHDIDVRSKLSASAASPRCRMLFRLLQAGQGH
jgi:hypothetical protein